MELDMPAERGDRYMYENSFGFQQANHSPIDGFENAEIVSLEEAVQPLLPFINNITNYVATAKNQCKRQSTDLTWDQSAAIYLYTMPTPLFPLLNTRLRDGNRHALKPWFPFLKLFISGLKRLPSLRGRVWRGVSNDVADFLTGDVNIWWSINSTSRDLNVVAMYIGEVGTLFSIQSIHGKSISEYSAFPEENEVMLLPGTRLRVACESSRFFDRLLVVDLIEEDILPRSIQASSSKTSFDL